MYTSPMGSLGASGEGVGGPCTRPGTDSAPFGMLPAPEFWWVPMYVRGNRACQGGYHVHGPWWTTSGMWPASV